MNQNNAEVSASYFVLPSSVGSKSDTVHFAFWDKQQRKMGILFIAILHNKINDIAKPQILKSRQESRVLSAMPF